MKERPILFSHQRVRALLSGQLRQTRRIMKSQPLEPGQDNHEGCYGIDVLSNHLQGNRVLSLDNLSHHCPYGQPGDRLWVRETWRGPIVPAEEIVNFQQSPSQFKSQIIASIRPIPTFIVRTIGKSWGMASGHSYAALGQPHRSAYHRHQGRKIQDISDDDVMAEGVPLDTHFLNNFSPCTAKPDRQKTPTARSGPGYTAATAGKQIPGFGCLNLSQSDWRLSLPLAEKSEKDDQVAVEKRK